jgi:transposase
MSNQARYSEAFKLQVVKELDDGKFKTLEEARTTYGVRGSATVRNWMEKYGIDKKFRKVVRVEMAKETDERKKLRKDVKALKEAVSDLHLDNKLESAFLKIACGMLGMSVEDFKKKHDVKR